MTARILTALSLRLDRAGESLHRAARRLRGEPEPEPAPDSRDPDSPTFPFMQRR